MKEKKTMCAIAVKHFLIKVLWKSTSRQVCIVLCNLLVYFINIFFKFYYFTFFAVHEGTKRVRNKNHICIYCGSAFAEKSLLDIHLQNIHEEQTNDGVIANGAPAHPHATRVAVYPALFSKTLILRL